MRDLSSRNKFGPTADTEASEFDEKRGLYSVLIYRREASEKPAKRDHAREWFRGASPKSQSTAIGSIQSTVSTTADRNSVFSRAGSVAETLATKPRL